MSKEMIQVKLNLIKAEAASLELKNGLWYADDVVSAMQRIKLAADEIQREAECLRAGDR